MERGTSGSTACNCLSHLSRGRLRTNALLIERVGPITGSRWQDHDRRELPSIRDGLLTPGQIMDVLCTSVFRCERFGSCYPARIDGQPQVAPILWLRQMGNKHISQPLLIHISIFQARVQARPFSFMERRQLQFGKRARTIFRQKGIHQVERASLAFRKLL